MTAQRSAECILDGTHLKFEDGQWKHEDPNRDTHKPMVVFCDCFEGRAHHIYPDKPVSRSSTRS